MGFLSLLLLPVLLLSSCFTSCTLIIAGNEYISALGDPGMRRDSLRVAFEGWNFCNEVGQEAPGMGSPRAADCFDLITTTTTTASSSSSSDDDDDDCAGKQYSLRHIVTEEDNKLGVGDPFVGGSPRALTDVDLYAAEKELYLGRKCEVEDTPNPWQFWMVMLKNGNLDTTASLCPKDGHKTGPFPKESRFPCFGKGCMNNALLYHDYTAVDRQEDTLRGRFYGTYDLDSPSTTISSSNISYYSVTWEKDIGKGSWVFHHVLRTSEKYPWLMLYLRSDATQGFSGGYHYHTRGMTKIIPESPDFKVRVTLDVKKGGGPRSQFYLMDMGGCWKNNGKECDGDVTSDVTRYSEMIINPAVDAWCKPTALSSCPPYHTLPNGTRIHRTDTERFPYGAYHVYCSPGNAQHLEEPNNRCDAYSNPQPQEIMQILPHPAWGEYGYPTRKGEGWVGDGRRTWELDVGRLSQSLYFYQDPGTAPARRRWSSLDVGTEIYVSPDEVAEWTVSDFDILIPNKI